MKYKIPSPINKNPRRTKYSLPSYRYVPGLLPHPFRHLDGHMAKERHIFLEADSWYQDEAFLYGADLFDDCFWWEAHEAWESCWLRAKGPEKDCIQGLIQLAAALLKHHMGHKKARDRLFSRAKMRLEGSSALGWELEETLNQAQRFFCGGDAPILGASFPKGDKPQSHEVSKCAH